MAEFQEDDIVWEAPEHHHTEKSGDWYWVVSIIAIAAAAAAIIFGNILFGLVILIGTATLLLVTSRHPRIVPHAISSRCIKIGDESHLYSALASFHIDEEHPRGPQLLLRSKRVFIPLIVIPIPEDALDEIEYVLGGRLEREDLEEPLGHRVLEFFGF